MQSRRRVPRLAGRGGRAAATATAALVPRPKRLLVDNADRGLVPRTAVDALAAAPLGRGRLLPQQLGLVEGVARVEEAAVGRVVDELERRLAGVALPLVVERVDAAHDALPGDLRAALSELRAREEPAHDRLIDLLGHGVAVQRLGG